MRSIDVFNFATTLTVERFRRHADTYGPGELHQQAPLFLVAARSCKARIARTSFHSSEGFMASRVRSEERAGASTAATVCEFPCIVSYERGKE